MNDDDAPALEVFPLYVADSACSHDLHGWCFDLPPPHFAPLPCRCPSAVHGAGDSDQSRSLRSLLLLDLRSFWPSSSGPPSL
eukprot:6299403-Heterocapsa_arctica.AAC.1